MKALILSLYVMVMVGCTREHIQPVATAEFDPLKAQLLKKGTFVGLDGPTSGMASVYFQDGIYYIVLSPFQTHSVPDMKVYLATDDDAMEYIKIGDLQSTAGRQVYPVPGSPKIDNYNFVHIWSEYYTVDYTKADVARAEIK